jgi:m7GpppX diphosphatase
MANNRQFNLVIETPHDFMAKESNIQEERTVQSKQWIQKIIRGEQESENVLLQNDEYIIIPDIKRPNRRKGMEINWLVIFKSPLMQTIRDLRGEHVPILTELKERLLELIREKCGNPSIPLSKIAIYAHYHPSVYQLHLHCCYPGYQMSPFDCFRVHLLDTIINNLEINTNYYNIASIPIPVQSVSKKNQKKL